MYELIQAHQLNIMLGLSSICFVVGFFTLITKSLPLKRKLAITNLEFCSAILLFSDRLAYIYHGDSSTAGFWMVRISNFLVFFMTTSVVHSFNQYLTDLCRNELGLEKTPLRLRIVDIICVIGWLLVIISQFTGLYYTFDENNAYQRGPGFYVCYLIPFVCLIIMMSVIIQYIKKLSAYIGLPLLLFTVVPMIASLIQAKFYGVSLTNMSIVGMGIVLYVFAIMEMNTKIEKAQEERLQKAQSINDSVIKSFGQTCKAIADSIDSKNPYSRGHSERVAIYSRKIARKLGMDEKESYEVYYSALLHETYKAGISLEKVEDLPFLKLAALYHRDRFDGKGNEDGLKGEEIPLIGRITAVANAYDEMTSHNEDREPFAQGKVREILLNKSGDEYDPKIVGIMVDYIDEDTEYTMRASDEGKVEDEEQFDLNHVNRMHFGTYKETVSDGVQLSSKMLKIHFEYQPDEGFTAKNSQPAFILFDSFDRCVHRNERTIKNLNYLEFGELWFDGHSICTAARDIKTEVTEKKKPDGLDGYASVIYEIEAVKIKDHARITIHSVFQTVDAIIALPDSGRFVYLGLAGEHCTVKEITVNEAEAETPEEYIPRIAPEITFVNRKEGDIPNISIDGYREKHTKGVLVEDGMRLFFHTQSMPAANLVVHCAHIVLFSSDDGTAEGKNYVEFACIRMDGEDATNEKATLDGTSPNKLTVHRSDDFAGWDAWKDQNKKGLDYEIDIRRRRNKIVMRTENAGINIESTTIVPKNTEHVYLALTGNMCSLMDIRIV